MVVENMDVIKFLSRCNLNVVEGIQMVDVDHTHVTTMDRQHGILRMVLHRLK